MDQIQTLLNRLTCNLKNIKFSVDVLDKCF